jgi:hypothetical protein
MLPFSVPPPVQPRRVQAAIAEAHQPGTGSVRQALCGALYEEVTDFYRLIATLEQQLAVPMPTPGRLTADSVPQQPRRAAACPHSYNLLNICCIHTHTNNPAGLLRQLPCISSDFDSMQGPVFCQTSDSNTVSVHALHCLYVVCRRQ